MKIILDCREHRLETSLKAEIEKYKLKGEKSKNYIDIVLETSNLKIGDAHILDENNEIIAIIERKTIKDLISSLRDGRYNEQSYRLNECSLENKKICYLLEGTPLPENKNIVNGCLVSLAINKGFSVISTKTVDDTAKILIKMCEKIDKSSIKKDYCENVHISKKSKITKDNIHIIMLTQIPSVSMNVAKTICNKYPSIKSLLHALEEDPKCLEDMKFKTTNGNGQERRISKTAIKNILDYLLT